jgi:glyoxylase-like metal-dependent hydrolase (beta-lactamase superfamily II)
MLREELHDDVTRLVFESWSSKAMGYHVSAYAVRGVLVDTGFHHVRADLAKWLDARRPDGAIVTHHHEDHAGNVEVLSGRRLPAWIAPETLARMVDPSHLGWYRRWCWGSPPRVVSPPKPFSHPALEVIHAPGHSPDHHVVWDAERETMFGADLFLGVKVRVSHPWPREDVRKQVATLRRAAALRPKRFFDAHRGLVPDAVRQLSAKADWIEDLAGRADALFAKGWTDRAIVNALLGGEQWMSYATFFDYSRRNLVGSLRATTSSSRTPTAGGS